MKKLVFLLLVSVAFAQEPIKFRGAYIGQPLSDYVDCSSGKAKKLQNGYRTHGKLCEMGKKGWVFHTKSRGFMEPKTEGEAFIFEDRKLSIIKIYVPNEDWAKVKYDLTEKLGPPTSQLPQVYQNGFGARWEFEQGFWSRGTIVAFAEIKVAELGGLAITRPFSNVPAAQGIEVTVTDAEHAKLPSTSPNSMD